MLPENVMSGRVESFAPIEIGAPLLASSKCVPADEPRDEDLLDAGHTSRPTRPTEPSAFAGFIVPAATRGSSASAVGFLFSEQSASAVSDAAQPPKWLVPVVSSSALVGVADRDPVEAAVGRASASVTPLAANTISLLW